MNSMEAYARALHRPPSPSNNDNASQGRGNNSNEEDKQQHLPSPHEQSSRSPRQRAHKGYTKKRPPNQPPSSPPNASPTTLTYNPQRCRGILRGCVKKTGQDHRGLETRNRGKRRRPVCRIRTNSMDKTKKDRRETIVGHQHNAIS